MNFVCTVLLGNIRDIGKLISIIYIKQFTAMYEFEHTLTSLKRDREILIEIQDVILDASLRN